MTLTIDIAPEVQAALLEAAHRQGQKPEDVAADVVRDAFVGEEFAEAVFLAAAEATRHVWDTPAEDAAWAHLQ